MFPEFGISRSSLHGVPGDKRNLGQIGNKNGLCEPRLSLLASGEGFSRLVEKKYVGARQEHNQRHQIDVHSNLLGNLERKKQKGVRQKGTHSRSNRRQNQRRIASMGDGGGERSFEITTLSL